MTNQKNIKYIFLITVLRVSITFILSFSSITTAQDTISKIPLIVFAVRGSDGVTGTYALAEEMAILDPNDGSVTTYHVGTLVQPIYMYGSSQGFVVYLTNEGVRMFDVNSSTTYYLEEMEHTPFFQWSPSGDHILYTTRERLDLYITDKFGSRPFQITNGFEINSFGWSLDGQSIIFSARLSDYQNRFNHNLDLYMISLTNMEVKRLIFNNEFDEQTVVSFDTQSILLSHDEGIYHFDVASGETAYLVDGFGIRWLTDGIFTYTPREANHER